MSASEMQKQLHTSKLPPMGALQARARQRRDYTPLSTSEFFDEMRTIDCNDGRRFNVYVKGADSAQLKILFLHGAGYTGATWACFVEDAAKLIDAQFFAVDQRAHGVTTTPNDTQLDVETLVNDAVDVCERVASEQNRLIITGHSMGGAIAARAAHRLTTSKRRIVHGVIVIDVVEGTAMAALSHMRRILEQRPKAFESVEAAIKYCHQTGMTKNLRAARVSMPTQLKSLTESVGEATTSSSEFREEDEENSSEKELTREAKYTWRTDLFATEPYWTGWFEGLSEVFLSSAEQKLLILAGVDRLDKDLTVAQMQGKFQTMIVGKVGHAVHEDSPSELADAIAAFCARHRLCMTHTQARSIPPMC